MKFLLDVCTSSRALRKSLVDLGHDVRSAVDVDSRASDDTLLDLALQEQRVNVSPTPDPFPKIDVSSQPTLTLLNGPEQWYILSVIPGRKEARKMSKAISLKLKDEVFRETEEIIRRNRQPRNAYFNEAIRLYNLLWKRKMIKKALAAESSLVAENSLDVLEVFERIEDQLVE